MRHAENEEAPSTVDHHSVPISQLSYAEFRSVMEGPELQLSADGKTSLRVFTAATQSAYSLFEIVSPHPAVTFERMYFEHQEVWDAKLQTMRTGVWGVIARIDQGLLQALNQHENPVVQMEVKLPSGELFTRFHLGLAGQNETITLLWTENPVHEDPDPTQLFNGRPESNQSNVLLYLSPDGRIRPDIADLKIYANRGAIAELHYVFDDSATTYQVAQFLLSHEISVPVGITTADMRDHLVQAVYSSDAEKMTSLPDTAGRGVRERGYQIDHPDFKGYVFEEAELSNGRKVGIFHIGKVEPVEIPQHPATFSGDLAGEILEHASTPLSGQVLVEDIDRDESSFRPGFEALEPELAAKLADFSFDHLTGRWSLTLKEGLALHALRAGEQQPLHYRVWSQDGSAQDIRVSVVGERETISGDLKNAVQEDSLLETHGRLISVLPFVPKDISNRHGRFTLEADGHYRFVLDNQAAQALGGQQGHSYQIAVMLIDGTSARVQIRVNGQNDASSIEVNCMAVTLDDQVFSTALGVQDIDNGESQMQVDGNWQRARYGAYRLQGKDQLDYRPDFNSAEVQRQLALYGRLNDSLVLASLDGTRHAFTVEIAPRAQPLCIEPAELVVFEERIHVGGRGAEFGWHDFKVQGASGDGLQVQFCAVPDVLLTSQGRTVSWRISPNGDTLLASRSDGVDVLRIELIEQLSDGARVQVALLQAIDHPAAGTDSLALNLAVRATQGGRTVDGQLRLDIIDDQPQLAVREVELTFSPINTRLLIALDVSGSMQDRADGAATADGSWNQDWNASRLQVAKQALISMMERYQAMGEVKVRLVLFHVDAGSQWSANGQLESGGRWIDISQALQLLNNGDLERLVQMHKGTDYQRAIEQVMRGFTDAAPEDFASGAWHSQIVFLSDGKPDTEGGVRQETLRRFQAFARQHQIRVQALGIGQEPEVPLAAGEKTMMASLSEIAYDGVAGQPLPAIQVLDPQQLDRALFGLTEGRIHQGSLGQLGNDGGYVKQIVLAGHSYRYDPLNHTVETDAPRQQWWFDPVSQCLNVYLDHGRVWVGMQDLRYGYSYGQQPRATAPLVLKVTLVDGDGDQVTSQLVFKEADQSLYPAGSAPVQLARDPQTNGSEANDTIRVESDNVLLVRGRGGDDILDARITRHEVELDGGSGNDYLLAGPGGSVMKGGAGDDVLLGESGSDIYQGGTGRDVFSWARLGAGTDYVWDFNLAEGDTLNFVGLFNAAGVRDAASHPAHYLQLETDGANTFIQLRLVDHPRFGEQQTVILQNVNLFAQLSADSSQSLLEQLLRQDLLQVA
jgi:VCBS repeat-containing protein